MGGQFGVENSKKIVDVLAVAGNVADKIKNSSGSVTDKLGFLTELAMPLLALSGVNWAALKNESGELDSSDKADLVAQFKSRFDLADDVAEAKWEQAVSLVVKLEAVVEEAIALVKELKSTKAPEAPVVHPSA